MERRVIVPEKNVEYTVRIPETGTIQMFQFDHVNDRGRVVMINLKYGTFTDFSVMRISYLLGKKCLISQKKIEQSKAPKVTTSAPVLDRTPVVADSDAEKQFLKMIDNVAEATGTAASEILKKTGFTPAAIAQKVKAAFNSNSISDAEFGKVITLVNKAYDILHPFGVAI